VFFTPRPKYVLQVKSQTSRDHDCSHYQLRKVRDNLLQVTQIFRLSAIDFASQLSHTKGTSRHISTTPPRKWSCCLQPF